MEDKMEQIQKRSLRVVLNDSESQYEALLLDSGKSTLVLCRLKSIATMMYKSFNNLNPKYVNDMYKAKDAHYNLRNVCTVEMYDFVTKTYGYKSLHYAGAKLWNSLPTHFKVSQTLEDFKKCLDEWKCVNVNCESCHSFLYHR